MAEAFRSALGLQERPASSYYLLPKRAEGQPVLNMQENGAGLADVVAPEERVEQQQERQQRLRPGPRQNRETARVSGQTVNGDASVASSLI